MTKRHIYVIDDEDPIRRSTRLMLTVRGYEVATFESGTGFLEVARALRPGAVRLDIRMPVMDGIEVQRNLNASGFTFPVVVMTGHGDLSVAIAALQQGAVGFLEKPFSRAALEEVLDEAFCKLEAPERFEAERRSAGERVQRLAEGERQLLSGLVRGLSNTALATTLGTTPQTVEARRAKLFAELGVETMAEALSLAFAAGLGPSAED